MQLLWRQVAVDRSTLLSSPCHTFAMSVVCYRCTSVVKQVARVTVARCRIVAPAHTCVCVYACVCNIMSVSVWLFVLFWASNAKVARDLLHGRLSVCIDPEVERSEVKDRVMDGWPEWVCISMWLYDWLHGFPRLFTDTFLSISVFFTFYFSFFLLF